MRTSDPHIRDLPGWTQEWDYDGRTDGQYVYYGRYRTELTAEHHDCIITKATYNGSGFQTMSVCKRGAWSTRTTLFT